MKNANKPVYPVLNELEQRAFGFDVKSEHGLTKREYFAAMAMQGLLANTIYHNPELKHKMVSSDALAECAVGYADHLLKALESTPCNQ